MWILDLFRGGYRNMHILKLNDEMRKTNGWVIWSIGTSLGLQHLRMIR